MNKKRPTKCPLCKVCTLRLARTGRVTRKCKWE